MSPQITWPRGCKLTLVTFVQPHSTVSCCHCIFYIIITFLGIYLSKGLVHFYHVHHVASGMILLWNWQTFCKSAFNWEDKIESESYPQLTLQAHSESKIFNVEQFCSAWKSLIVREDLRKKRMSTFGPCPNCVSCRVYLENGKTFDDDDDDVVWRFYLLAVGKAGGRHDRRR